MFLNKNQENLLIEISLQHGDKSINSIGKKVYKTYVSIYNNIEILKIYGYIDIHRKKNRLVPSLTNQGIMAVKIILEKNKELSKDNI